MARIIIPAQTARTIYQQACPVCGQDQWVSISAVCRAEWVGDNELGILFIEKPVIQLVDQEGNPLASCPGCEGLLNNPQEGSGEVSQDMDAAMEKAAMVMSMYRSWFPETPNWIKATCPGCQRGFSVMSGRDIKTGEPLDLGHCSKCGGSLVEMRDGSDG